ncbi:NAD(P)/FAD-dependent oxidoreductase [Bacillus sp. SG-1]|uniref:NAD(P)/FAD-dependent oxidoreductase n=1 Tax=Bacillus sp. SG-1 TaxID=161544 RepID=UPI00015437EA|nr:FAD-dependent oxidoreductase [Bacillus sp. SG-1]EDL65555.1 pyridine nucleotide-disulfide oxidoreductase [Bacillus sp. SG-1]
MKKLLLIGGGHSHLHVIKRLQKHPLKDVSITLISPSKYQYYSGMFSGYTEGLYSQDDIRVNLQKLAESANINWIEGAVLSMDPNQKVALTDGGEVINFDAASFDIGSMTASVDKIGAASNVHTIKPNYKFIDTIDTVRRATQVVIAGGGAAGIELSASLTAWRRRNGIPTPVTLITGSRLLNQKSENISRAIEKELIKLDINLRTHEEITSFDNHSANLSSGENLSFDELIWLTGPKAPDIFRLSKLPVDSKGYIAVEDTLQVKQYPFIFAAGECASMVHYPDLDKAGVYAVKQGPVLYENIKGFFESGEGLLYKPQSKYLSILSLGNKRGFAMYGNRYYTGKPAWMLKNRIDTRFVKQYNR